MEFEDESRGEPFDIDKTMAQMAEAWKCVPHYSLTELVDELVIRDMEADEVYEFLDEFITQYRV